LVKAQAEIFLRNSERQRLLELRRRHWLLVRLVCGAIFRRFGVVRAISEQLQAVELRLKQCKERVTALG
jgi:hypothetical protein